MEDEFDTISPSLTSPAESGEVIVPSDGTALAYATRGLYVGVGGDAVVRMLSGDVVTLKDLQAGSLYPIRVTQVLATGTSATNLIGMR